MTITNSALTCNDATFWRGEPLHAVDPNKYSSQVLFGLKGRLSPNHGNSDQNFLIALLHLATLKTPTTIIITSPAGIATMAQSLVIGPRFSMESVVIDSSVATKLRGMKKVASHVSHSLPC